MARRRIHLTALTALPALLLLAGALAPVTARAADTPAADTLAPPRTVSAWLPYWDQENAYQDALEHAAQIRTISPFWYQVKSAGRVDGHPGAGERRIINGLHDKGIQVVPTVMETMKPGALGAVMTSADRRAEHIDALLAVVRSRDYDGIDLDYETIAPSPDATYRAVRTGYADFVTGLCARLHEMRKQCFVTVTPKTRTSGRVWDYERLGAAADRVRVMAYNLHYAEGAPGPLSTPQWYDEILATATAQVPRAKLEMGLPAYGWNWAVGDKARARHVTWKDAEALRRKEKAPYTLDPDSSTPHFTYQDGTTRRTVWYQDARGTAAHLTVLRDHGVPHTVLWALGFEDPGVWKVLADG
ncbi:MULTISPECIES: glycosyl hydrolase family 18 protein [unclassified Streptomyces]|uniref:glycosyl hydrolase family 18 protein n=1 Tax=unclassified Streptomyces TaxID=2593676 RepID=UPI000DB90B9C|nr:MULTISPECIES: glycosyl hydrolase family 18 protein [unclassified Streptomyces]MYT74825.1 glycosyl hydrolase [Streptomyces sp. SID8367]RAJ91812.1 glycosyl hydrolase family 18 (putative chitinase) [Streptomyces sp. PsTaAH-137]